MKKTFITMAVAVAAYRDGNNRGAGYAPYTDEPEEDSIEEAVACAERDGWTLVLDRTNSDTVTVLRNGDGELLAIGGDAMVGAHGPWTSRVRCSRPPKALSRFGETVAPPARSFNRARMTSAHVKPPSDTVCPTRIGTSSSNATRRTWTSRPALTKRHVDTAWSMKV